MKQETGCSRQILEKFVVFEGIDGTGTTTQLNILSRTLAQRGVPHFMTSEPTDSELGRIIRRVLSGSYPMTPETLAYLYATDRNEHIFGAGGILENIRSGKFVVSDRYLFSSLAYQGISCGNDLAERLNRGFPLPSLLVYFELSPETALERISARGAPDMFERREFLRSVSNAYERILERYSSEGLSILRVDGSLSIPKVTDLVWNAVAAHVPSAGCS